MIEPDRQVELAPMLKKWTTGAYDSQIIYDQQVKWYYEWHKKWTFQNTTVLGTLENVPAGSALPRLRS